MSFSATAFRACAYETPLWSFPNLYAGRWNRPGAWPAQYLSLHPMTAWAELLRNLDRRDAAQAREMRVPIWTVRIELREDPVDLHFSDAPAHALEPADLVADRYDACQALAGGLLGAGVTSITAPSAALPGTRNLVVFEPAAVIDYDQRPIDASDWPAALVAQDGRCPEGLWASVHYRSAGIRHAELDAFLSGDHFAFEQPPVTAASLA